MNKCPDNSESMNQVLESLATYNETQLLCIRERCTELVNELRAIEAKFSIKPMDGAY